MAMSVGIESKVKMNEYIMPKRKKKNERQYHFRIVSKNFKLFLPCRYCWHFKAELSGKLDNFLNFPPFSIQMIMVIEELDIKFYQPSDQTVLEIRVRVFRTNVHY